MSDRTYDPATATEPKRADQSLGELFGQMTRDVGELFRKEVELAKLETKEEVRQAAGAGGAFAGAGVGGLMVAMFVSLALALLLDQALNTALSFAIVAVLWAVVAAVLVSVGRKRLQRIEPLPNTTDTIKEDITWAKTLKR